MKIIEKLALQHALSSVLLFKEGLFFRAYNQGAYILTELLGHNLKIRCVQIKKYQYKWIVDCAFPVNTLYERLPNTILLTDFGCQLAGDFNLDGYDVWLAQRCLEVSSANVKSKAGNEALKTYEKPASSCPTTVSSSDENLININLRLTRKQLLYIQTWQRDNHLIEADLDFIENLKSKLILLEYQQEIN